MGLMEEAAAIQPPRYVNGTGRTLVRLARLDFQEATTRNPKNRFKVHGVVAKTSSPAHQNDVGNTVIANLLFNFPDRDLERMQQCIRNAAIVKFGMDNELEKAFKALTDANLSADKEASKAAQKRIADEMTRLVGEEQPLLGTPLTIVSVEAPTRKGGTFTSYQFEIPSAEDLAGL
jgi:hypothetical protein